MIGLVQNSFLWWYSNMGYKSAVVCLLYVPLSFYLFRSAETNNSKVAINLVCDWSYWTFHRHSFRVECVVWYLLSNWIYICRDISSSLIVTVKYSVFSKCHVTVKNADTLISVSIIVILKFQIRIGTFLQSIPTSCFRTETEKVYLTFWCWKNYEAWYFSSRYFYYLKLSRNLEYLINAASWEKSLLFQALFWSRLLVGVWHSRFSKSAPWAHRLIAMLQYNLTAQVFLCGDD